MIQFLTRRSVQIGLLLVLLLGATWLSGANSPVLRRLQYQTFDTFNALHPRPATDKVIIVDIDEESLARLGQWPWPRDIVAKIPQNLKALGASSVAFDIVFAESDRTTPALLASRLPEEAELEAVKQTLKSLPDNDHVLADAIHTAGNVVTGFVWAERGHEGKAPFSPRGMVLSGPARDMLLKNAETAHHIVTNLPDLEKAAAGNGSFSVSTDLDGIVRRVPMVVKFAPEKGDAVLYPSLALEALRVTLGGRDSIQITPTANKDISDLFKPALTARIGNIRVPLDKDGQIWVYYARQLQPAVPAWRVVENQMGGIDIRGKIVVIGTSAEGLKDIRSSPLDLFVPGVEMHANILEQALQNKFISRPALVTGIEAVFIFTAGLLVIALAPFVNVFFLLGFVVLLVAGAFALSWHVYTTMGILIDPVYPSLAVSVMFVLSALLSYLSSEMGRKAIRGAFGLYISPDFMRELTRNPDKLKLGGEIKELTLMFTDIRNFTTIAEGMTPQVLIHTMNDFLTPMSDEVMKARGTIDKYMGDAMMAFWNAPLDVEEHERKACQAALAMRQVLAPVNDKLKTQAEKEGRRFYPLNCGIGINTGPVAVGNMGSRQRFAYSALGDAVNLASRLEGQTKTYGVSILLGEKTALAVPDMALMDIDYIRVKGRAEPARIFTLLGDERVASDTKFKQWSAAHDLFLHAYRTGAFADAMQALQTAQSLDAQEQMADYYMVMTMRLKTLQENPPSHEWDGVYTAQNK